MKEGKELSLRLQQVADFVVPCQTVADVGCDHGYVSIYLLQHDIAKRVIAMDVRTGPLSRAEQNRNHAKLQTKMECRLSDGLDKLRPKEADVIVIAGMGGPLMTDILEQGREKGTLADRFVLQPQSDIPAVRRYLHKIGYQIIQEAFLMEEGKYYTVIQVEKARIKKKETEKAPVGEMTATVVMTWQDVEYQYGKCLLEHRNPVLLRYLEQERELLKRIHAFLVGQKMKNPTPKVEQRLREIIQQLRLNQEAQGYYSVIQADLQ